VGEQGGHQQQQQLQMQQQHQQAPHMDAPLSGALAHYTGTENPV